MTTMPTKPKFAIGTDFFTAFAKIPKSQQAKVHDFIQKFTHDPTLPGINFEKIQSARDSRLRSVRIDQIYRGIILKPETENIYMLLWVDRHDDAYKWAENRVCAINPETGAIQIVLVDPGSMQAAAQKDEVSEGTNRGLFSDIRDRHLIRLGVPEALLPMVRSIRSEKELDKAATTLPDEASEALYMLAMGYGLDETLRHFERSPEEAVAIDTEDFATALDKAETRRNFYVVENELELAEVLSAPLEKWRVFLHPTQRRLVERNWNGPVRVLGGAGTGKTVAAIHRAKWLAEKVFTASGDRILFTTFTKNLAADIRENLSRICTDEALRRIEVINLDKWVAEFLRRNGYGFEIDYGRRTEDLWKTALTLAPAEPTLPSSFFREEWERVIQAIGISTFEEYLTAPRLGRGVRLSRRERKAIWPVFEEYMVLLKAKGLKESEEAMRDARIITETQGGGALYKSVIVDEAQDLGPQAFRLLRAIAPSGINDLFIVGDAHQRIYRHKVILGQCGINIVGRSKKLLLNYRTTDETRRWAVSLLNGVDIDDLDGGLDSQKGYRALLHGIKPEIAHFETMKEEIDYIAENATKVDRDGTPLSSVCLVARTIELLDQYETMLRDKGIETYRIHRSKPEDRRASGLRLATMHRVKGLEFDRIIIAGANEGVVPLSKAESSSDKTIQREHATLERSLLYVAATRAKGSVLITSWGKPSPFLTPSRYING